MVLVRLLRGYQLDIISWVGTLNNGWLQTFDDAQRNTYHSWVIG